MRIDLVFVKLGAVFILVYALQNLAYYMTFIMGSEEYVLVAVFVLFLVLALPALISWVLWRFPSTAVASLYRDDEKIPNDGDSSDRAFLIGVSLLGVYTLVFGVIDLAYFEAHRFAEYRLTDYAEYSDFPILPQTVAGRFTNIIQIVLGMVLIYGRHGIAAFLRRLRLAGVKSS